MGAEKKTSDKVLYPELSYALQGAFYEVYNVLGPGFREETYRQALMQELQLRGIPFETEKYYDIPYKLGVADRYRADFVVDDKIIVELKAVVAMPPAFEAYLLSYLRASKLRVGYLVNFGAARLQLERRVV
jgi:GxxExxY protein